VITLRRHVGSNPRASRRLGWRSGRCVLNPEQTRRTPLDGGLALPDDVCNGHEPPAPAASRGSAGRRWAAGSLAKAMAPAERRDLPTDAVPTPSLSLPRAVMVAAVLGTSLAYMSDDMLNLAVPSLARELGASMAGVQWILNSYYVTLVAFVLIAGSIGDIVGHRRVFSSGLVAFSAGAVLCATAPSVPVLVVGRALQGLSAAMLLAAGLALVTCLSPPEARNREVGTFFGLVAAVPALGPFLSGVLVDALSWRWLFVVPLVLPVTAWGLTHWLLPETPRDRDRHPDVQGAFAALVALCGLSVALILGPGATTRTLALLAAAVAVAAGTWFVFIERRRRDPLLPLGFFRRRRFLGGNLVWLLGCLTCWGAVFFVAVTLQVTLGLRPVVAGLVLTPIYLVMMVGSPLAGVVADRYGPSWPILGGLIVYIGGLWLLAGIGDGSSMPYVLTGVGVFAVGMAGFTAPLAAATLSALDDRDQGVASAVNNAVAQLAGLLAILVLPAAAGLSGANALGGAEFATGYSRALQVSAAIATAGILIAVITFWPVFSARSTARPPWSEGPSSVVARRRGGARSVRR
jgi:EmrB/QacA subfamily drug resistance transporter